MFKTPTTALVTGATGTLGRILLPTLCQAGVHVRAMSRRPGSHPTADWAVADLGSGEGLAAAVTGVDAVVHLASAPNQGRRTAEVDVAGTRRLAVAAAEAGVRHLVYVSIVGVDRVPLGYYRIKLAAEAEVSRGAVPWTVLRATQFPQLMDGMLKTLARSGFLLVGRRMVSQPVHPQDVAKRIVDRIAAGPLCGIEEFGGPEVLDGDRVARQWRAARGLRRPIVPLWLPGRTVRAVQAGALTTTAQPTGSLTWADYLAATYPAGSSVRQ